MNRKDTLEILRGQARRLREKDLGAKASRLRKLLEGIDRDYRIGVPWWDSADQPRGWHPDINDGVRVNIAPVQRVGLLAAGVLSANDLVSFRVPEGRASR